MRRACSRSLHNRAETQSLHSKNAKHIQYCIANNKLNINRLLEQSFSVKLCSARLRAGNRIYIFLFLSASELF